MTRPNKQWALDVIRWRPRDIRATFRVVLITLAIANLVAAYFVLRPPGGSPEELRNQRDDLQTQVQQKRAMLTLSRSHSTKVEKGRSEGEDFVDQYFLNRRSAYSTVLTDLLNAAKASGIKPKEHAYLIEPIEGSDTLSMMSISGNYEGTYSNLMHFVNALDRSKRLMIVEGLQATPQQSTGVLNVSFKLNTFVKEDGSGPQLGEPTKGLPTGGAGGS